MTGGLRIARFFGIEVRLDYSWFVVFFLVLWWFAQALFPQRHPGLGPATYVAMGVVGAFLFFSSVLLHELAHSAVARARGIEVEGITLFIFGGMARIRSEAETPKDEFLITVVGPLSSVLIGLALFGVARASELWGISVAVTGVADELAFLNFVLAAFNLVPGFPLDGGRLLRSLIWYVTGDLRKATRWPAITGRGFGFLLVGLGMLSLFSGLIVNGMWLVLIGWFLAQTAGASYRQLILRRILEGVLAREAMTRNPETVRPDITLSTMVDEYLLRRRYNAFPVEDDAGRLLGLITLAQIKAIDRDRWPVTEVGTVMMQVSDAATVRPDDSLAEVLSKMETVGVGRALVVNAGRLEGVITRADVAQWLERYQQLH